MALQTCENCGLMMSDRSSACPHCGHVPGTPLTPVTEKPAYSSRRSVPAQKKKKNYLPYVLGGCAGLFLLFAVAATVVGVLIWKKPWEASRLEAEEERPKYVEPVPDEEDYDVTQDDVATRLRDFMYGGDYSDIVCNYRLEDTDIAGLPPERLRILRNTVYARHGYIFKSKDLKEYFSRFDWYRPLVTDIAAQDLSEVERHNVVLIQSYE